ncbi:hypothetical protein ETAA8_22350 [Anatilimnocola aggregata]|uniref:Uncharacterized protein n=1 Tax=Anatilimnocola aggregata TaxID=2528021 RepID=A0A517YA84_9BACT|nr:hypothetical protein [Anatilimnocola aggregata]QDU27150.1 hypothetical protein ETAA8_22350 [Anatilimnocola aggregata]
MVETAEFVVALYVDRTTQQWVVRDRAGNFWSLPSENIAWENRRPFEPLPENSLEPIPGHYRYLLRLPF